MTISYAFLGADDASLLSSVADGVFDKPVDPARTAAYLAEPGHHMLVARDGDLVVAQVAAVIHRHPDKPTDLYVDEVGVAPSYQRRGIAREMVERMFAFGRSIGCEIAWLGTEPDNVAARALYRNLKGTESDIALYEWDL